MHGFKILRVGLCLFILTGMAWGQWDGAKLLGVTKTPVDEHQGRNAMDLDEFGNLHLIYYTWVSPQDIDIYYVNKPNSGQWSSPVPIGDQAQNLMNPTMGVHKKSGTPYILYQENGFLKIARREGVTWKYFDLQKPSVKAIYFPIITVDDHGIAHVAFVGEYGGSFAICYGFWNFAAPSLFPYQKVMDPGPGVGMQVSRPNICAKSDASVAISYLYNVNHNRRVDVAENDLMGGTSWTITSLSVPSYDIFDSSIKAANNDDLHLGFYGNIGFGMPGYVYYANKAASAPSWSPVEKVSGAISGMGARLAITDAGIAHMVFEETSGNFYTGNLCFTTNATGAWVTSYLIKGENYSPSSFVLDKEGHGNVAFSKYVGNMDIFLYGFVEPQGLVCDTEQIKETSGGVANFTLDAGPVNGMRPYLLLGCVSGVYPGIDLPGGFAHLPLNWDLFTNFVIVKINTTTFQNFMGFLNGSGEGLAQLNTGPIPGLAGLVLYFTYGLASPWDFVSNPVVIEITP